MCIKCIENDHAAHSFKSYKVHMKERAEELLPKLQSAKNKIKDLDEEITKQQLNIDDLKQQIYLSEELKEKMKCEKERFSKLVEMEKSLEIFVKENKNPSNNILHNLISDQTLMDLESSSVKFAFEIEFENVLNLKKDPQVSEWRPYGGYNYAIKLQYSIKGGTPWLGIFLSMSKVDIKEDFSWEEYVKYRISILNNIFREPISKKSIGSELFSSNSPGTGWTYFLPWGTLLNTKLGWHSNHSISIRVEILR